MDISSTEARDPYHGGLTAAGSQGRSPREPQLAGHRERPKWPPFKRAIRTHSHVTFSRTFLSVSLRFRSGAVKPTLVELRDSSECHQHSCPGTDRHASTGSTARRYGPRSGHADTRAAMRHFAVSSLARQPATASSRFQISLFSDMGPRSESADRRHVAAGRDLGAALRTWMAR